VPGLDSLVDQKRPVRLLTAALQSGKIPHAFLFTGTEGIGKMIAAETFAMACNCLRLNPKCKVSSLQNDDQILEETYKGTRACGECRSCKKILSGNHPDMLTIKPSGKAIKIDQIRNLCRKLTLKPYEASVRFALILNANKLNVEAGNTLLKTLEEPPDRTVFILTAIQTSDILPTILSRCQHIQFNPISHCHIHDHLKKEYNLDTSEAMIVASAAEGSMSRANELIESNWLPKRKWVIHAVDSLSSESIGVRLSFSESLFKKKEWLSTAFKIIKTWLRDIAIYRYVPEKIINIDLSEKIEQASKETPLDSILHKYKAVEDAERNLQANANLRLILDTLVLELSEE